MILRLQLDAIGKYRHQYGMNNAVYIHDASVNTETKWPVEL